MYKPSIQFSIPFGRYELRCETGAVARQANGSAMVRYGDLVVIATACMNSESQRTESFLPLICDYRENTFAAGKFPGGFFKREGKPSEKEILTSRIIDRSIRPLFPEGYFFDTQVIASVYSASPCFDPDVASLNAASVALLFSDIPFYEAVIGVRIAEVDGEYIVYPTLEELEKSPVSLLVAGTRHGIVMVEAGARSYPEEKMAEAIEFAHQFIKEKAEAILAEYEKSGWAEHKLTITVEKPPAELEEKIRKENYDKVRKALEIPGNLDRYQAYSTLVEEVVNEIPEEDEETRKWAKKILDHMKAEIVRKMILEERRRPDGREWKEIRDLEIEVGLFPRTHGSALFRRGETKAVVTCTLGTAEDAQKIEDLTVDMFKRFMLHYNFPPFSVGEVSPLRAPSRREIGHGALAERALLPVIPDEETFPYTIRVVSDILESNGSSSMATVCGGSLALMDAGVPITSPVAGIAMGLFMDTPERYAILTDIAGEEDHTGDMDFKVAGTREGITALQMDIKLPSLPAPILREALFQAREARMQLLDAMEAVIPEPRKEVSPYAPRLVVIQIPQEKIANLIGPGGRVIKSIIEKTNVKIDIKEDGKVIIAGETKEACEKAVTLVREVTAEVEKGRAYLGKVTRITDFGAFVEILTGIVGLLHKSELAPYHVQDVRDIIKHEGQEIVVRVLDVDNNRIRLSHKEFAPPRPRKPQRPPSNRRKSFRKPRRYGKPYPHDDSY